MTPGSWLLAEKESNLVFCRQKRHEIERKSHDALKTICGTKSSGATTLLSAHENTLLSDTDDILERWTQDFNSVLNGSSATML